MAEIHWAYETISCTAEGAVEKGDLLMLGTAWPQVKKTTGDTVYVIGVALAPAATTEQVKVGLCGVVCNLRASTTANAGVAITPVTDGEFATAAQAGQACGITLEAASAENDDVPCLIGGLGWLLA